MPIPLCEGEPTGAVMLSNLPKSRQVEDVHYVGLVTLFKELLYVSVGASKKKKKMSTAARLLTAKMETTSVFINKKRHELPRPCAV